jgi:hypothetical protein
MTDDQRADQLRQELMAVNSEPALLARQSLSEEERLARVAELRWKRLDIISKIAKLERKIRRTG